MDVIFDIDGMLANAEHRLHLIIPPTPLYEGWHKDWDTFLSDEMVARDTPIEAMFTLLSEMFFSQNFRVLFLTGRKESSRDMSSTWISQHMNKGYPKLSMQRRIMDVLFMRSEKDRRPSSDVKRDLLNEVRAAGYDPKLVFEDRADDTAMWRSEGLLCCQVAKGEY